MSPHDVLAQFYVGKFVNTIYNPNPLLGGDTQWYGMKIISVNVDTYSPTLTLTLRERKSDNTIDVSINFDHHITFLD